jgi:hypothetical protein
MRKIMTKFLLSLSFLIYPRIAEAREYRFSYIFDLGSTISGTFIGMETL